MIRYAITDPLSRRETLQVGACGFGWLAFAGFASANARAETPKSSHALAPKAAHFKARAKRVIFLCMSGGPSHLDLFDYKPKLQSDDGKTPDNRRGVPTKYLGSPFKFSKQGKSGIWMSELMPQLGKQADDICMLNGMHTAVPAHAQAFLQMHTGTSQFVRPSLGAWTLYGLGTENENLPGFISINPPTGNGGAQNYGNAFLPAIHQGTRIGGEGRSVANAKMNNITNGKLSREEQRLQLDFLQSLNRETLARDTTNPHVEGVIESYELAFRMQSEVPKLMDLNNESKEVRELYGIGDKATDDFGRQCLLARRFVEAGVRFVEITHGNWDHHRNLRTEMTRHATAIDRPIAALLKDLKRRGLLEDTLVVWSGEFGRTPYAQGTDGRDHNNKGYTAWMAGGGVKGGFVHGKTDDYGAEAIAGKVHTHDFHATILHLMGLDHEKLTYNYAGRDFRLTDVAGNVVKEIVV